MASAHCSPLKLRQCTTKERKDFGNDNDFPQHRAPVEEEKWWLVFGKQGAFSCFP